MYTCGGRPGRRRGLFNRIDANERGRTEWAVIDRARRAQRFGKAEFFNGGEQAFHHHGLVTPPVVARRPEDFNGRRNPAMWGRRALDSCRITEQAVHPAVRSASFASRIFSISMSRRSPDDPSTLISIHRLSSGLCPAQHPSNRTHGELPSSFRTGFNALSALLRISELDMDGG